MGTPAYKQTVTRAKRGTVSKVRQLYELQEVDLEIEAKRQALSGVESQLGESEAVVLARAALDREQQHLAELDKAQRLAEWEVDDLRSKAAELEKKLYGGSVKSPKELMSLQEQIEHLNRKRRQGEDHLLDIMAEAEAVQTEVDSRSRELASSEEEWRQEQQALSQKQAELQAALATLDRRREELSSRIDAASLELYHSLRARRQGTAVAKVEQGMCQGCRIALPMTEMQRVRIGQELVQCSSCGRILYLS